MTVKILRPRATSEATGLPLSTLYAAVADGKFPRPIKLLGARASGWRSDEIQAWIEQRTRESREAAA